MNDLPQKPQSNIGTISKRVIFSSYVNGKEAWNTYGDFILFSLTQTKKDILFCLYWHGEPYCVGNFGAIRYSDFNKHLISINSKQF